MSAGDLSGGYRVVERYHRQEQLEFFQRFENPYFNVSLRLDVTRARSFARDYGYSTYFNLCWHWTRALADVEDFRYRIIDGELRLFDHLLISATVPVVGAPYGFARFGWNPDLHAANREALDVIERVRARGRLGDDPVSPNHVFFSAMPKVPFTGMSHVRPNGRLDGEPRISFGRFELHDGRCIAPVGVMVNHVFIDGGALGEAVERVEASLASPGGIP